MHICNLQYLKQSYAQGVVVFCGADSAWGGALHLAFCLFCGFFAPEMHATWNGPPHGRRAFLWHPDLPADRIHEDQDSA